MRPMLKSGSRGDEISFLQQALNQAPFGQPRLTADGIFGQKTHGRVAEFQGQNHLQPDGIVGPKTHGALEELYALIEKLVLETPPQKNARLPDWCGIFCLSVYKTSGLKLSSWPLRILTPNPEFKAVDGNAGKYSSIIERQYTVASATPDNMGAFRLWNVVL